MYTVLFVYMGNALPGSSKGGTKETWLKDPIEQRFLVVEPSKLTFLI